MDDIPVTKTANDEMFRQLIEAYYRRSRSEERKQGSPRLGLGRVGGGSFYRTRSSRRLQSRHKDACGRAFRRDASIGFPHRSQVP